MITLNKTDKNLLLIDYPSGGYGFYLARLINSFVTNVVHTPDSFLFDHLGTSHGLPLVAGEINTAQNRNLRSVDIKYKTAIDQQKYVVIPYCPGIQDDTTDVLKNNFSNAKIIRLYYYDNTWPLVFENCITKATAKTLEDAVEFDPKKFGSSEDWARRENYSLLCEHHHYRNMWKEYDHERFLNIDIFNLLSDPYQCLIQIADFIQGSVAQSNFLLAGHQQFLTANPAVAVHLEILRMVNSLYIEQDLTHISHLYHQAVLNFYVQSKYKVVIPANDYANWFTNTKEIVQMLHYQGVDWL